MFCNKTRKDFTILNCVVPAIVVILISLTVQSAETANVTKGCSVKQMDQADIFGARVVMVGYPGRKYPENNKQMPSFCRLYKNDVARFDKHLSGCLRPQSVPMMKIVIFSLKTVTKNFCGHRNKKRTRQLLGMARCANANNETLGQCVDQFAQSLNRVALREEQKRKIPQLCCNYHNLMNCIRESTQQSCPKYSVMIVDLLGSLFNNVVEVVCTEYSDSSDKCRTLSPVPKPLKSDRHVSSFFSPLLQIWESV